MKLAKHAYVGIGVVAALGIAMPGFAGGNKYGPETTQFTCSSGTGEDGTVTLVGPLKLWPPNHKMIDEPVTAQRTDKPGSSVTLTLTPVVTDATGGDGGPQHDPDYSATSSDGKTFVASDSDPDAKAGTATAAFQVRAERSGKGDGRTYTINWMVDWGNGDTCSSNDGKGNHAPFVITVPHDMSGGAGWKP